MGCRASPKGARLRSSIAFALDGFEKTKYGAGPRNDSGVGFWGTFSPGKYVLLKRSCFIFNL